DARHRAPACDRAAREPHRRARPRRNRRRGHAFGADAPGRALCQPCDAAVPRQRSPQARTRGMRLALAALLAYSCAAHGETLHVGSKRFTESYVLGEVLIQVAQKAGASAEHKPGLGNTGIVFAALKAGSIDLYPEYTGTIAKEILKLEG